jgi:hypothetical protein
MNLQEKESTFAAALGGFACGGVLGLPCEFGWFSDPIDISR